VDIRGTRFGTFKTRLRPAPKNGHPRKTRCEKKQNAPGRKIFPG